MGCHGSRGELFRLPKIRNLFAKFNYEIFPTSSDSSNQNGPVEHAHRNVFIHVLRIRNALPGQGQDASPLFLSTGKKDNFRNLRIFGCRVWV